LNIYNTITSKILSIKIVDQHICNKMCLTDCLFCVRSTTMTKIVGTEIIFTLDISNGKMIRL